MDVVTGIVVAGVTALVIVGGGLAIGFAALFRRRNSRAISAGSPPGSAAFGFGSASIAELSSTAGSALVRMDDAVRAADHELGFAIAQFGAERSREFGQSITVARTKVAEAFRLRQLLDDSIADSDRHQREWTLQIIALCEQASAILAKQDAAFAGLRRLEVGAADAIADLRRRTAATRERVVTSRETLARLEASYSPVVVVGIASNISAAESSLAESEAITEDAAPGITSAGVSAVSGILQRASEIAGRAEQLLDAVDRTERDLASAEVALASLRESTRSDLDEAKKQRDTAPDAESGRAIIDAMAAVDEALATGGGQSDPVSDLDRIGEAVARLDLAMASARNQADRLAHARAAYAGTLVSAASQIAVVRDLIGGRGVGVSARTKLAEAERQYALAQVETDPVEALDTIRRAVTLARDADALARYSA